MSPFREFVDGMCWWCRSRAANTGEHIFKASDLRREHGPGQYLGATTLVRIGSGGRHEATGVRSDVLKFKPSMCDICNNQRSKRIDNAYDAFVGRIRDRETEVLRERAVALDGPSSPGLHDVARYFVKHACCRIYELKPEFRPRGLPADLIAFLDGGPWPAELSLDAWAESTWLRAAQTHADDPLWTSPFEAGPVMVPSGPDDYQVISSTWRYGWLMIAWEVGIDADGEPWPATGTLPVPLLATEPATYEWAFAAGLPPVDSPRSFASLIDSPIAQMFLGGALDCEAGTRGFLPERRRLVVPAGSSVSPAVERARLTRAISLAAQICGVPAVKADLLLVPAALRSVLARSNDKPDTQNPAEQAAVSLSKLAIMKTIEAAEGADPDQIARSDEALDAASYAGKAAAAAGISEGGAGRPWEVVSQACTAMVEVGAGSDEVGASA